jgi:hypothetical protein
LSLLSKSSVFSLISILSLSAEILSSTCSSLLEWTSTVFFFNLMDFLFQGFLFDSFFWGLPYLCPTPLSYLVLPSLFHRSLCL